MNLMKSYNERQRKERVNQELDRMLTEWMKCADIAILFTLHTEFGFGAERCRRFYLKMIEAHKEMRDRFQSGNDESHYWVMEKWLKDDGIDVAALQREAENISKQNKQKEKENDL